MPRQRSQQPNSRIRFFQEFVKNPKQIGAIIPSSRFLERRVLRAAGVASARTIVELGSGTGGTTRAILREMRPDARLLSIEINPLLNAMVSHINDERLIAHLGSADELEGILNRYGLDAPEIVISGIPFSTMDHHIGSQVLRAISSQLAEDGRFVAYQFRGRVATMCRPLLGSEDVELELRNIPPMRVYHWRKEAESVG